VAFVACGAGCRFVPSQPNLEEVWGHGVYVTDRLVDNHIVALRKKMKAIPRRRGI
jgi:DNA-binding response OmpR family regulator